MNTRKKNSNSSSEKTDSVKSLSGNNLKKDSLQKDHEHKDKKNTTLPINSQNKATGEQENLNKVNPATQEPDKLRWWILFTVIIGTFLGRLDGTIVNLAVPKIINDFGISVSAAGWIATAYILANAVFVPIWGKLGDSIGRKKVYIIGFVMFIVGSILAGLAWDLNSMIFFRIIQAIAGSADYPTAMAIIAVTFRGQRERAQALGIWSSSFAAASVFGPLIGGPLIDTFGWRSVFLMNLPVGILGLVLAIVFIHESKSEKKTLNFDWWGAITLGICLASLVLVLEKGISWGWTSTNSLLCYVLIIVFGIIFFYIDKYHPEPIVDFKFFKNSAFVQTSINNFLVFMALMGVVFIIPLFAQIFLGYDATETGYLFIPLAAAMLVAAPLGGALTGRVKPNIVIFASTLVAGIGALLFYGLDARSTALDLIIPFMVIAFGMGFGMAQRTNVIASVVGHDEIGIASSLLALIRNIAGAFGIAVFATIITYNTQNHLIDIAKNTVINQPSLITYKIATTLTILKAEITAYNDIFIYAAIVLIVGAFFALSIKVKDEKKNTEVMIE